MTPEDREIIYGHTARTADTIRPFVIPQALLLSGSRDHHSTVLVGSYGRGIDLSEVKLFSHQEEVLARLRAGYRSAPPVARRKRPDIQQAIKNARRKKTP